MLVLTSKLSWLQNEVLSEFECVFTAETSSLRETALLCQTSPLCYVASKHLALAFGVAESGRAQKVSLCFTVVIFTGGRPRAGRGPAPLFPCGVVYKLAAGGSDRHTAEV